MSDKRQPTPSPIGLALVTGGCLWATVRYWPGPYADDTHLLLWGLAAILALVGCLRMLPAVVPKLGNLLRLLRALRRDDTTRGSAGWLSEREARAARLHRRRRGSRLIGLMGRTPLWLDTETAHLILGPAGSQKSTSAILNILAGCADSALINDVKGELFEQTATLRALLFGHRAIKIDPKDPAGSAKINPLDFIIAHIEAGSPEALTLVRGMVLQLYPEPSGDSDANKFFRDGTRLLLVSVILAVAVVLPPEHRTLATVYRALGDMDVLHDLLTAAMKSEALGGEVADMATSTHASAFGEDGAAKTFEQFRIGAVQAMEAFGPGNYLAAITSETTFSFADLKSEKLSVYLIIDFANKDVLGKFSGLMQWLAAYQLVGVGNTKPVLFVLDEFCNTPLYVLPTILTLLRTYGVKCILATQDLDDIVRVYSKHALETVLSETDIKQFLGGIRSQTTLEYLSKYLGEYSETTPSYSLGRDGVQESLARTNRRLMTEDELRRLPDGAQIVLKGNHKPALLRRIQIFAVSPWRRQIGTNSLYGGTRKLLPVELRIGWLSTRVTAAGRRAYVRITREMATRKQPSRWRLVGPLLGALAPTPAMLVLALLALGVWQLGAPNLRWEYAYRGARDAPISFVWCRYVGPTSPGVVWRDDCPLILWRKTW